MGIKRYRDWTIQSKVMMIPLVALVATMIGVQCLVIPFLGDQGEPKGCHPEDRRGGLRLYRRL